MGHLNLKVCLSNAEDLLSSYGYLRSRALQQRIPFLIPLKLLAMTASSTKSLGPHRRTSCGATSMYFTPPISTVGSLVIKPLVGLNLIIGAFPPMFVYLSCLGSRNMLSKVTYVSLCSGTLGDLASFVTRMKQIAKVNFLGSIVVRHSRCDCR